MGFFWCCCDCICRIIGDIYGAESGEPPCEGKIDVVPIPCDTGLDSSRVRWQVVRTSDTPETVVFEGDYTDFLASSGADGYLRFYMTEDGTYELRIWYEPEGYAPPCEGLPTAANPFVRVITNEVECCPNSCPIDPPAIRSSVTLSGYSSDVTYDVAERIFAGGGYIADYTDPVGFWKRTRFIGYDILNGTFSTNEVKQSIATGDYDCIRSLAKHKLIYLGEIEVRHQEFYNSPFVPPGPTTQAHAKGKVWLSFGSADITGVDPAVPASPDLHGLGTDRCRIYLKTTEYQTGQSWNLDNSPRVHGPVSWPGSATVGDITRHYLRPDDLGTINPDDLERPCLVNYGPTWDHPTAGYPNNGPVLHDDPTYDPDWHNYHQGVGGAGATASPWPCRSVWVVS